MVHQEGNIGLAFPDGGDVNGNDVETVKQIFPKAALLNLFFKIFIGGADHAYIHGDGFFSAYFFKGAFLKEPQQLYLQKFGQFGDFIQKNGAIVRQLETAFFVPGWRPKKRL